MLSENPLMSIALSAQLLERISISKKRFESQCKDKKDSILELGKTFNQKIDDGDHFERLIYDTDFQNRTALKIIFECKLEPLLNEADPKS